MHTYFIEEVHSLGTHMLIYFLTARALLDAVPPPAYTPPIYINDLSAYSHALARQLHYN